MEGQSAQCAQYISARTCTGQREVRKKVKIRCSDYVEQQILKNLLTAQGRAADRGDANAVIQLSKYLLRLLKKLDQELVQFRAENQ